MPSSFDSDPLGDAVVARRLASFARGAEEAIFVGNADGRLEWANDAACRLSGRSRAELAGSTVELFPDDPEAERAATEHIRNSLRSGESARLEAAIRDGQGHARWISLEVASVDGPEGSPPGWVAIASDITDRKRREAALAESEERYRTMVERSPEPAAVASRGRLVYVNRAAMELLGTTSAEAVLGRSVFDFVHPDFHELVAERIRKMEAVGDPALPMVETLLRVDGSPVDVELAATPILWQGALAIQMVAHVLGSASNPLPSSRRRRPTSDLSGLVLALAPRIEDRIAPRAAVTFDLEADLPRVEGERATLTELVAGLVTEAAAALPGGRGRIRLSTDVCQLGSTELASFLPQTARPGRLLRLEVRHDGRGPDPATLRRLVEGPHSKLVPVRGLTRALAAVRVLGGALHIDRATGDATRLQAVLPA